MAFSDTVREVIALAEAIHAYWSAELPRRHPNYPLVNPGEDDGPPPPEEKKLRDLLESQPKEVIYRLLLLMHLGRHDFDTSDLAGHYKALKRSFGKSKWAVELMVGKASLAGYLLDGLEELRKHGIDVDSRTWTPTSVGS